MLFYFYDETIFQSECYEKYLPFLPPERREKALAYKNRLDRNLCVFSFLLLRYALDTNQRPATRGASLLYPESGKPYLSGGGNSQIYFNLSHCAKVIVCAIADQEIGVDIQDTVEAYEKLLARVCSKKEQEEIQRSEHPAKLFTSFWTLKEAYLKYRGTGLTMDLHALDFSEIVNHQTHFYTCRFGLESHKEYAISWCNSTATHAMQIVEYKQLEAYTAEVGFRQE